MTEYEPQCPICFEPTHDGLACSKCTGALRAALKRLPSDFRDLTDSVTRQSQAGSGNGGKGAETVMPFDWSSSVDHESVVNTISTWIRDLAETYGEPLEKRELICTCEPYRACQPYVRVTYAPGRSMGSWCKWLLDRMHRIRQHQAIEQLYDELMDACKSVRKAIDRPADRVYVCVCDICGKGVYSAEGAEYARCKACALVAERSDDGEVTGYVPEYDVKASLDAKKHALATAILPLDQALIAIDSVRGRPLNPKLLRSWVTRGRLKAYLCDVAERVELYAVEDALTLAAKAIPRKQAEKPQPITESRTKELIRRAETTIALSKAARTQQLSRNSA